MTGGKTNHKNNMSSKKKIMTIKNDLERYYCRKDYAMTSNGGVKVDAGTALHEEK